MHYLLTENLHLEHSLLCGQVFRWKQLGEVFYGFINNTPIKLSQKGNSLYFSSLNDSIKRKDLIYYFNLNQDLKRILKKISKDQFIEKAVNQLKGLRIISQNPWECLLSFVLSQYSNIPKINQCIEKICENYGKKTRFESQDFFLFPSPKQILQKGTKKLNACSLGYRKEFVKALVKEVHLKNIELNSLIEADHESARNFLLSFKGVGLKVADSVCLFSLKKFESFPIDVWIQKIMNSFYFNNSLPKTLSPKKYLELQEFARNYFGEFAGYAQQHLYHYYRLNPFLL
jgi:N-glycosylase/DNA lyase